MVVNLTVENNSPFPRILENRLIAALQVDDFQSGRATGKRFRGKRPLLVRAAMVQGSQGLLDSALRGDSVFMREAGDAAQALPLFEKTNSLSLESVPSDSPSCPAVVASPKADTDRNGSHADKEAIANLFDPLPEPVCKVVSITGYTECDGKRKLRRLG
jgi:hypothetical protein